MKQSLALRLALTIRDRARTMLHPAEERLLADRVIVLEDAAAAASRFIDAIDRADAFFGGDEADIRASVERAFGELRAAVDRSMTPGVLVAHKLPLTPPGALRQLWRWVRTVYLP